MSITSENSFGYGFDNCGRTSSGIWMDDPRLPAAGG